MAEITRRATTSRVEGDLDAQSPAADLVRVYLNGIGKTALLNAADEVAVAAFLEEHIRFDEIPRIIEEVMAATPAGHLESIQRVLSLDTEARLLAREIVHQCRRKGSPIRAIS